MSNSNVPPRLRRLIAEIKEINESSKSKDLHITCKNNDKYDSLECTIPGPKDSLFENGIFNLAVTINQNYPFQPPTFKFVTPIYHPNIDTNGNICLDLLKLPPSGSYNPTIKLESILLSIQLLLATPNPEDPLMLKIAEQYKYNRNEYNKTAEEYTRKFAIINVKR